MNRPMTRICTIAACGLCATVVSYGQIGKITQQDWVTSRADAQRTSWIRSDAAISAETMQKGGFEFQWKVTLDNQPRQLNSLSPGVVIGNLGFGSIPLSFITGSANRVFAVDNDTGIVRWLRAFDSSVRLLERRSRGEGGQPDLSREETDAGTPECPGGITSAATRPATLVPTIPVWRGLQDRVAYTSGVGAPGEGVPAHLMGRGASGRAGAPAPAAPAPAPAVARAGVPSPVNTPARAGGPAPAAAPLPQVVYVLSSDGQLHTLGPYSGKDLARPLPFLPPGAHASDLIALNNIVYATTMNGCGGVADGVWALDLASDAKAVKTWTTGGGSPAGAPAFGMDGTLYVAVGARTTRGSNGYANAVIALDPRELTVTEWFTMPGAGFVTAPLVFRAGSQDVVAAATRDGSIVLLDATSLGGPSHGVSLSRSTAASTNRGGYVPGGLATWEDSSGTRWLLVPTETTIVAMKVTTAGGVPALQVGWTSRQLRAPLTPIVVNGVVFVVSSGKFVPPPGVNVAAADRARQSVPAVLYALDAATGRELWSSGNTITSFAHGPALWPGIGQVHVAAYDNTVYAFGFAMERY